MHFSFGWHSKFKWNNQQFCKTIIHRENVDIPAMEMNSGNETYSNFHKSFTSLCPDNPNFAAFAFRCTPTERDDVNVPILPESDQPILPESDQRDFEMEPEYDKTVFDLSKQKDIPVIISQPTTRENETSTLDGIPLHKQNKLII